MLGLGNSVANSSSVLAFWTPLDISGLIHWYKYNTAITTVVDDFGAVNVVKWEDQKGDNSAETSGIPSVSPLYSSGAVKFNSADDVLTFDSSLELGEFSIYFRVESSDLSGDILVGGSSDHFLKINSSSEIRLKIGSGNRSDWTMSSPGTDTPFTLGAERDSGGAMICYLNGSDVGAASSGGEVDVSTSLDLTHMGDPAVTVTVYEALIFNEQLSSLDRSNLHTYLSNI